MSSKKSILWISWHPNPYNNYLFEEFHKHYDLEVIFIKSKLSTHPWDVLEKFSFKNNYFDKTPFLCLRIIFKKSDLKVVAGWNHYFMIFALGIFAIARFKFVIWTDTPNKEMKRSFLKQLYHNYYLNLMFKRAFCILVTGKIGVQFFKEIYGKELNVINFPFATNLDFYKPQVHTKERQVGVIKFISVGRLVNWHKGYDVAIKAFNIIKMRYPNLSFQYNILGEGIDRPFLERLIEEYDLKDSIKLSGWCNPDKILEEMQKSHVFIHPSHFDPFPNVVLEAMAVGLPVIGSNAAGSVLDRLNNKVNGMIFQDNDVHMLAEHLNYLIQNISILSSMSQAARATAESFSVNYNITQISKLTN
jgi:glycosyltransferase involved in cell wall biosynthesis